MNKDKKTLYTLSAIYIITLTAVCFVPNDTVANLCVAVLCLAAAIVFSLKVKKRCIHAIEKKQVALVAAAIAVIALTVYYISGISLGYRKVILLTENILKYILPYATVIVSAEIIRSIILDQRKKSLSVLFYFVFVALDVAMLTDINALGSFNGFSELISLVLFPSLATNVLCHGLSYKYGRYPSMCYRLIIGLYSYFIPIAPDMPNAMLAFVRVGLPLCAYLLILKLYAKRKMAEHKRLTYLRVIGTCMLVVCLTGIVMLVSCQFKYGLLVIGSGSMTGEIDKGDAVIYEQYDGEVIENGQVILFNKDNTLVIHRVIDIQKINGVTRYYTKGDANESADSGYITEEAIVGTSKMKIKYVGYPTIWMRELFNK